jgi:hypothetical protein
MTQPIIGYLIFALLAALVFWLNIAGRKERTRRRMLPPEERALLADEDRTWMQRYGF